MEAVIAAGVTLLGVLLGVSAAMGVGIFLLMRMVEKQTRKVKRIEKFLSVLIHRWDEECDGKGHHPESDFDIKVNTLKHGYSNEN